MSEKQPDKHFRMILEFYWAGTQKKRGSIEVQKDWSISTKGKIFPGELKMASYSIDNLRELGFVGERLEA